MTTNQNSHNFSSQTGELDSGYLSKENSLPSLDQNNQESSVAIDTPMQVTSPPEDLEIMDTQISQRFYWWQAWQFWGILLIFASGGIGYGATSMLLKLPETESC